MASRRREGPYLSGSSKSILTMERQWALMAPVFLASGAALVVYVLSGVSLLAGMMLALCAMSGAGMIVWRRAPLPVHIHLLRALRAGLVAGLLATGVYDLSRYLLIETLGLGYQPFKVFSLFGQALIGPQAGGPWVTAAGAGFHLINGVTFAIAYTLLLGRRGVLAGIGWAMGLEVLMVAIYPGWLGLKVLDEFLQVSIVGHVAYGAVLGLTARRLLRERRQRYGSA